MSRWRGTLGVGRLGSLLAGGFLAVLAVAGCDDGAGGPGTLTATLSGPAPMGAAVLEVEGPRIQAFDGTGSTRIYTAPTGQVGDTTNTYRVVLVNTAPGNLVFRVEVEDLDAQDPRVTVVSAVDGGNQPVPNPREYRVRFSR